MVIGCLECVCATRDETEKLWKEVARLCGRWSSQMSWYAPPKQSFECLTFALFRAVQPWVYSLHLIVVSMDKKKTLVWACFLTAAGAGNTRSFLRSVAVL